MEQTKRILLVDDDAAAAYVTQRILRESGTEIDLLTARHGQEALDIVRQVCQSAQCPELILLDIHMPVMNGFEFMDALQQLQETTGFTAPVVVLLTTSESYLGSDRATQYPIAKGFLTKPLTGEHVDYLLSLAIYEEEPKEAA